MYKFRASYTILSQWQSGNWEMAVKMYFKLDKFVTRQMQDGREWHEKWAEHIMRTGTMPVEFGAAKLRAPVVEQKKVVPLEDWLDLVGIIDCYDTPVVYEWKTGKQSSEAYAGTYQGGVYSVLATLPGYVINKDGTKTDNKGFYTDRIELHHYDQYSKKSDMSQVWITPKLMDEAHNWVLTLGSEMHNYFLENKLYERYLRALPAQV